MKVRLEYKTETKTDKIEVDESLKENMLKAGWTIAPKKKKVKKDDN